MSCSLAAALAIFASASAIAAPRSLVVPDSSIEFTVKEMGVPVTGKFTRFDAAIDIDELHPEKSSAVLTIDTASLDTGNDEADAIAVDTDWLDKAHAPRATFRSTAIRALGSGRFEAQGLLDMKGRLRDLGFQFTSVAQPDGKTLIAGDFAIRRSEFGVGAGQWNQDGVVAEEIPVKVRLVLAPLARK